MVKITDVAAKAGVAKSTVSNVLTGRKFVSEELRQKVLTACKELDFQPNFCASGLSGGSTHIIALVMEATADIDVYPFYKDLLLSCMRTASTLGYSLLVYYDSDKNKLMQTLRQGRAPIDGAILLTPGVDDERLSQMESAPLVRRARYLPEAEMSRICSLIGSVPSTVPSYPTVRAV